MRLSRCLPWIGTALLMLLLARPTMAHGGGVPQLVQVPAGPYELWAWTSPDPARVGTLHVTVALAEPKSQAPVFDADVLVTVSPQDANAQPLVAKATHLDAANKLTYETDVEVPQAGPWRVSIDYSTPAGQGSAGFPLEVRTGSPVNWLLMGGIGLALVAVAWLLWPGRGKQQEPADALPDPTKKVEHDQNPV